LHAISIALFAEQLAVSEQLGAAKEGNLPLIHNRKMEGINVVGATDGRTAMHHPGGWGRMRQSRSLLATAAAASKASAGAAEG
jgi:hypothetical protein